MDSVLERPPEVKDVGLEHVDAAAAKAIPRLFDAWLLGNDDAAELLRVHTRTYSRMKSGEWIGSFDKDQRTRASALVGIYKALHVYFSDGLADRWIQLPNKGHPFEGRTPLEFMLNGDMPAILFLRNYVDALRGGA